MHSSRYILFFVTALCAVAALILSFMYSGLKDVHERNEAVYNKKAILSAIESKLDSKVKELSGEEVQSIFSNEMDQLVVQMDGSIIPDMLAEDVDMKKERKKPEAERLLPLYKYSGDAGDLYVVSVRGNGLWDEIWGSIALEEDLKTIAGAAFDHTGETPGLGAEIKDNPGFARQFIGKKIYNESGEYTSIVVKKGGAKDPDHEVDAIGGATVTCDGVTEMLVRGLKYYEPYLQSIKN